jgi:GNAT superfamily N-acetyltransferase
MSIDLLVCPLEAQDRDSLGALVSEHWAGETVISRGRVHHPRELDGYVAEAHGEPVGFISYFIEAGECEVVVLLALRQGQGVGTALLQAVRRQAQRHGCRRVWLITTNDNLRALRFYQRRGFELVAVHRRALDASRRLKPSIPLVGEDGIPLRDEIELEMLLA